MNRPRFQITIDGALPHALTERLIELTLTENSGFNADTLTLTIDDADGLVAIPPLDATIQLSIGTPLIDKGAFVVDSVTHQGPPDRLVIGAHSADFKESFTERRSGDYHKMSLKEIVEEIAERHGFEAKVGEAIGAIEVESRMQSDESDANFLTRLAQEFDAIAALKQGVLLFIEKGEGKSASGMALPIVLHHRSDGDQHHFSLNARDRYTGVEVRYLEAGTAKRKSVTIGDDERIKRLRTIYSNKEEATDAGEKELKRLKRGAANATFNFAEGNARITADTPLRVMGFKAGIVGNDWSVQSVTHSINGQNGFTTSIGAEVRGK